MEKVVVILSGGMDSTTLLFSELSRGYREVHTLSFFYGQRHSKELLCVDQLWNYGRERAGMFYQWRGAHRVNIEQVANMTMRMGALTGGEPVPHGHYEHASMKSTVVPNRNMVFLAIAGAYAVQQECTHLSFGAHAGDHAIYPDCRSSFVDPLGDALVAATDVVLEAPFLTWDKRRIAEFGRELKVPFELTWSCYEGGEKHCGKCGTCVERKEALGANDPTEYA